MRVLYISLFHPDIVPGGAQAVAYELFNAARQKGVDAFFMASVDKTKSKFFKPGAIITGFERRDREFLFLVRDYDYWWHRHDSTIAMKEFLQFITQIAPDVIHVHHFLTYGVDIFRLIRTALPKTRIVFTFHEFLALCAADGQMLRRDSKRLCYGPEDNKCTNCFPDRNPEDFFMRRIWMKLSLEECDQFIVPSAFMVDFFVNQGFPRDKFKVVENPIMGSPDAATPIVRKNKSATLRFGYFGQMVDNKGFLLLLRAIELLKSQGKNFFVEFNGGNLNYASKGAREEFLAALEAERALPFAERRFEWNGEYGRHELSRLMSKTDVVVVSSEWWEIYCLVVTEAWMHNKAVIGPNVGGPGERIVDGVNGMRFPVGDYRGLAETMGQVIDGEIDLATFEPQKFMPPDAATCFDQHMACYVG